MSKRLSHNDVSKRLNSYGFKLLEPYKGILKQKHDVKCHCGNIVNIRLQSLYQGKQKSCGCSRNKIRISTKEINTRLSKHRFKLAGQFMGTIYYHDVICFCGNIFKAKLGCIFNGDKKSCGCTRGITGKYSHEEIQLKLDEFGFLLKEKYKGIDKPHKIQCFCGNIFQGNLSNIFDKQRKSCGCQNTSYNKLTQKEVESRLKKINIKILEEYQESKHKIKFQCFCGKIFYSQPSQFFYAGRQSCGCIKKDTHLKPEEIEKRFKECNLTLVGEYQDCKTKVQIKCFCGKVFNAYPDSIFCKYTKSCGCLHLEAMRSEKVRKATSKAAWRGHGEISACYFNQIKNGAKDRDLDFDITIEDMWKIFLKQNGKCALSGIEIFFTRSHWKNEFTQTASLDRIDSSRGYKIDNIQWIHKGLNRMKNNTHNDKFIEWCKRIANHHEKRTK